MSQQASATPMLTAQRAGLARCPACGVLHKRAAVACRRCGKRVHQRVPFSLQRTWAFLFVGVCAYIPAMTQPVMFTRSLSERTSNTILGGVWTLVEDGSSAIALIIFVASVCIPLLKFVIIAMLASTLQFSFSMSTATSHRLHHFTELIGRWSMIDVFVIAILTALIQLGTFMTVVPGIGIDAFAVSVLFTMLAANSLDTRLFWDKYDDVRPRSG